MKMDTFFKYLFGLLICLMAAGLIFMAVTIAPLAAADPDFPIFMYFMFGAILILVLAYFILVPSLVYKDAKQRGMNEWMWVTIATFLPNLLGIIIYIIVRSNYGKKCLNCGKHLKQDYELCPYCGHSLNAKCSSCGKQVDASWKVCPYCKQEL